MERLTQKKFEKKKVPTGHEVCEKQLFNLVDKIENAQIDNQIEQYLPIINKKLEWLSREDLIKHFVAEEFNRFLSYYKNAPDLNVNVKAERSNSQDRKGRGGRERGRDRDANFLRFFVNIGSKDGLDAGSIISMINKHSKGSRVEIGKIDILKNFSFFEIEQKSEKELIPAMKKASFKGIPVVVQPSKPDTKGDDRNQNFSKKKRKKSGSGRRYGKN